LRGLLLKVLDDGPLLGRGRQGNLKVFQLLAGQSALGAARSFALKPQHLASAGQRGAQEIRVGQSGVRPDAGQVLATWATSHTAVTTT
jgi:hypothetical protein